MSLFKTLGIIPAASTEAATTEVGPGPSTPAELRSEEDDEVLDEEHPANLSAYIKSPGAITDNAIDTAFNKEESAPPVPEMGLDEEHGVSDATFDDGHPPEIDEALAEIVWYKCFDVQDEAVKSKRKRDAKSFASTHPSFSKERSADGGNRTFYASFQWKGGVPCQQRLRRDVTVVAPDATSKPGVIGWIFGSWSGGDAASVVDHGDLAIEAIGGEVPEKSLTLDELYEAASTTSEIFKELVIEVAEKAGLDPSLQVFFPPLKGRERCRQKAAEEYGGDISRVVDVVRCRFQANDDAQLIAVANAFKHLGCEGFDVVRFKNRFAVDEGQTFPPTFGHRDALFNVAVEVQPGITHICEVQLQLASSSAVKEATYPYYLYFRTYFAASLPNDALKVRLLMLRRVVDAAKKDAKPTEVRLFGVTVKKRVRNMEKIQQEAIGAGSLLELQALDELLAPCRLDEVWLRCDIATHLVTLREKKQKFERARYVTIHRLAGAVDEARALLGDARDEAALAIVPLADKKNGGGTDELHELEKEGAEEKDGDNEGEEVETKEDEAIVGSSEADWRTIDALAADYKKKMDALTFGYTALEVVMADEMWYPSDSADVLLLMAKETSEELARGRSKHRYAAARLQAEAGEYERAREAIKALISDTDEDDAIMEELRSVLTDTTSAWLEALCEEADKIERKGADNITDAKEAYKNILRLYHSELGVTYDKSDTSAELSQVAIVTRKLDEVVDLVLRSKYQEALQFWSFMEVNKTSGDSVTSSLELLKPEDETIAYSRALLTDVLRSLDSKIHLGEADAIPVLSSASDRAEKVATVCNALGLIEYKVGSYEQAYAHLKRSLNYLEATLGKRHAKTAQAYVVVADAARQAGWPKIARTYCRQALWIGLSLSGFESEAEMTSDVYAYEIATSPIVANAYRALGLCERDTKDFTEAKKLYKRALQVFLATGLTEKDHECVETQRLIDEVAILVYEERKKAEKKLKIKLIDWMVCKKKADEPEPTGDPKTCPCKSCTARREIAEGERRRREAEEAQRSKEETEARQAKAIARKKYKKNMKEAKRWASAHTFKVGDLCQWDEEEDEDIPAGLLGTVEAVDEENREIDVRFPNGDVFTLEAPDLIYVAKTWENFYSKDHNPVFVRIHDWATKAVASIPDNR